MFFSTFAQGEEEINECMSDVYFANGINTMHEDAKFQLDYLIEPQVSKNIFNSDDEKMNQTVSYKLAYNNTLGIAFDLLESYGQKKAEHGTFWWTLGTIYDVFGGIAKQGLKEVTSETLEKIILDTLKSSASQFIVDPLIEEVGLKDLVSLIKDLRANVTPKNVWQTLMDSAAALENYDVTKQLGSYKNSIKLGHSAIVIAHSQGNLFTNVVYDKIATSSEDKWMTRYFYMIGVASPAGVGTGPKGIEIVTFDNDPITNIPDTIGTPIENPMRSIVWSYTRDNSPNSTKPGGCLPARYLKGTVPKSCVDKSDPEYDLWTAFDENEVDFHYFTYYMNTEVSRDKIINFVGKSLEAHEKAPSQWETNEEFDKNTCNYKITVKHQFDSSIEMGGTVYPFNVSKKLYQVKGEYVKASCGGKNILSAWDGKKEDECWMIDNVEKEKIVKNVKKTHFFRFYTRYTYSIEAYNTGVIHRADAEFYGSVNDLNLTKYNLGTVSKAPCHVTGLGSYIQIKDSDAFISYVNRIDADVRMAMKVDNYRDVPNFRSHPMQFDGITNTRDCVLKKKGKDYKDIVKIELASTINAIPRTQGYFTTTLWVYEYYVYYK